MSRLTFSRATGSTALIVLVLLVLATAGCGDDPSKPEFQPVGRIQGQILYHDDAAPAGVFIQDFRPGTNDFLGNEWRLDVDGEGRFEAPLPEGSYGVIVEPGPMDRSNDAYITPWGYRYSFDPDSCGYVVAREMPPVEIHAELGRIALRLEPPFDDFRFWYVNLLALSPNLRWSRTLSGAQGPDRTEIQFDLVRMPMVDFVPTLRTPYGESLAPPIFLGDTQTTYVRPDAQALESYEIRLPEPTWLEVRTTPIAGAPNGLFAGLYASAAPLTGSSWIRETISLDPERTMGTGRLAVFSRNPFRVAVNGSYSAIFAGGPREEDATIYLPDPGNTISVEIGVGAIYCRVLGGPNLNSAFRPLRLTDGQTGLDVAVAELYWDSDTQISESRILMPPGTFELELELDDLDDAAPQRFAHPIEVHVGEVQTIEWTLSPGATLHGRFGTPWQAGDRLEIRKAGRSNWRVNPELGPDRREFAIHNVPDGYFTLVHQQENVWVYYPGTLDDSTAEVIHVSGSQDIYGLNFLR